MGKSSKKIKSERINTLRKQYDAFLDEDKKRKDRNEFILGRLEKMRMFTPVPVQHMGNPLIDNYCTTQRGPGHLRKMTRFDNNQTLLARQTDLLPNYVTKDEQIILKEISKKFILIPKLRATNENSVTYYNPPSANDDTDWRNKYNILDELKKIEKEGTSEVSTFPTYDNFSVNNDHDKPDKTNGSFSANSEVGLCDLNQEKNTSQVHNLEQINENAPIAEVKSNKDKSKTSVNNSVNNTDCKLPVENNPDFIPSVVKRDYIENKIILPVLDSISQDQNHILDSNKGMEEIYPRDNDLKAGQENENKNNENTSYNRVQNVQQNNMNEIDHNIELKHENEVCENIINVPVAQQNTPEVSAAPVPPTNATVILNKEENIKLNLKTDEIVQQPDPVLTTETQEPCDNIDQVESVSENAQLQEYEPNNEANIIAVINNITSQIDEFEAEQKEMFYPEVTEYNQNVEMEYTAQNNEYTNEQYYYNESQQEQPYYAEVNEHEESTERYDPNYEQQYANDYEGNVNVALYDNQQYDVNNYENQQQVTTENYEQQPVNFDYVHSENIDNPDQTHPEIMNTYESQANEHVSYEIQHDNNELTEVEHTPIANEQIVYENQQDYVQMHTEQGTIQNLEKQLEGEEGYIENTNIFPNESASEVQPLQEIQQPDINTT